VDPRPEPGWHPPGRDNILLAGSSDSEAYPAIAADSANHRYLVVWELDTGNPVELYGHLVGPYGNLIGDPSWSPARWPRPRRCDRAFKPPSRSAGQAGEAAAGEYLVVYRLETGLAAMTVRPTAGRPGRRDSGELLIYDGPAGVNQASPR